VGTIEPNQLSLHSLQSQSTRGDSVDMISLKNIPDGKTFERLCADLLEAEEYIIESEPSVDVSGVDLVVIEEYRSHDPSRYIRIRWRVQCKHYARSGKNLGRKEVEQSLYEYELHRYSDEGLFIITSTDYSEHAKKSIDEYVGLHPNSKVTLWNNRHLLAKLERHPRLIYKYNLHRTSFDYKAVFSSLKIKLPKDILLISDQSSFAHTLTSALNEVGFRITFIPFMSYSTFLERNMFTKEILMSHYDLILFFMGDSFPFPLPQRFIDFLCVSHIKGRSILFFPFLVWVMNRGLYSALSEIVPVQLMNPANSPNINIERISGDYRRGDFRWLSDFDSFAEDHYVELSPGSVDNIFIKGIDSTFGISHSFEYLVPSSNSRVVWEDTTGNPFIITNVSDTGKVCYVNSCCHSCLTVKAIPSPLESTPEFSILIKNTIEWLLEDL